MMDQGTERWLLTFRWMLWLAPAGLRGGLKLEAYHQSRQPQSFSLCGPRCFWDFGSWFRTFRGHFSRAVAAAVSSSTSLRPTSALCRGTSQQNIAFQMFLQLQTFVASLYHVMSRQACLLFLGSTRRCGVTVCLESRRRQPDVAASPGVAVPLVSAGCCGNW